MSESEPDRNREPLFWSALLFAVIVLLDYWRSGESLFSIAINALWAGALCVSLFFVGSLRKRKVETEPHPSSGCRTRVQMDAWLMNF
jgi:hypothetical protein